MAINVADILHAATQQGILGKANQIYDDALGKDQATLNQEFASIVIPKPEKEVVPVLTAATTAPESPSADDLYINTFDNKLYKYSGSAWVEETQSRDVVYITDDTSHLYLWNGTEFTDVTGQEVDGVIYITSYQDLDPYVTAGIKTVAYCDEATNWTEYSTLTIETLGDTVWQTLSDKNGYSIREKEGASAWTAFDRNDYAFEPKMKEVPNSVASCWLRPYEHSVYKFVNRTSTLTINLYPSSSAAQEYHMFIEVGNINDPLTVNWPQNIEWNGGEPPTIAANNIYEVSIMDGIALFVEIEPQTPSQS